MSDLCTARYSRHPLWRSAIVALLLPILPAVAEGNVNPPDPFGDLVEQSVAMHLNADAKPDYVMLLKHRGNVEPGVGRAVFDLVAVVSTGAGYETLLEIDDFWKPYDYNGRPDLDPAELTLSTDAAGRTLNIKVIDTSDDQLNQQMTFRWERNRFRLIRELKSASPRDRWGRWARSRQVDWLAGISKEQCHSRRVIVRRSRIRAIYIDHYDLHGDPLDEVCH